MSGKLGLAEACGCTSATSSFPLVLLLFFVLYVESCHLQSWQVLSLLFHAFWHWNGWIIVNFFWTKFYFIGFSHWLILFFTSFFPLSLCASLDMAHRGVLRCVSSLLSFLSCFFFPCWGLTMWYTHVILPCSCPNTIGFANFSLTPLPCLVALHQWGPEQHDVPTLCSHACCLSISFSCLALCRLAPLCYTGLSLKVLDLKVLFLFLQDRCCAWSKAWVGTQLS